MTLQFLSFKKPDMYQPSKFKVYVSRHVDPLRETKEPRNPFGCIKLVTLIASTINFVCFSSFRPWILFCHQLSKVP